MSIAIPHPKFDAVEYIRKLRNAGVSQEAAEVQAQEIDIVIQTVLEQTNQALYNKELATKGDIEVVKQDIGVVKHDIEVVKRDLEVVKLELQKEIADAKSQIIIWVAGLLGTFGRFRLKYLDVVTNLNNKVLLRFPLNYILFQNSLKPFG